MRTSVARTGFAAYTKDTSRNYRQRLSLLMRAYGAWMVRAEVEFSRWQEESNPVLREMLFERYMAASSKAARMYGRHSYLCLKAIRQVPL